MLTHKAAACCPPQQFLWRACTGLRRRAQELNHEPSNEGRPSTFHPQVEIITCSSIFITRDPYLFRLRIFSNHSAPVLRTGVPSSGLRALCVVRTQLLGFTDLTSRAGTNKSLWQPSRNYVKLTAPKMTKLERTTVSAWHCAICLHFSPLLKPCRQSCLSSLHQRLCFNLWPCVNCRWSYLATSSWTERIEMSAFNRRLTQTVAPQKHQHQQQQLAPYVSLLTLHRPLHSKNQERQRHRRLGALHAVTGPHRLHRHESATQLLPCAISFCASTFSNGPLKISTPQVPQVFVSCLASGFLIGAAGALTFHLCGPDNPLLELFPIDTAPAPLLEFGPADFVTEDFGPTRPLSAMLLQHFHQSIAALIALVVLSVSETAATALAAATTVQPCLDNQLHMAVVFSERASQGDEAAIASLISEARCSVEDSIVAVRGSVLHMCNDYNRWLKVQDKRQNIISARRGGFMNQNLMHVE